MVISDAIFSKEINNIDMKRGKNHGVLVDPGSLLTLVAFG
jgi:hypothetical protein